MELYSKSRITASHVVRVLLGVALLAFSGFTLLSRAVLLQTGMETQATIVEADENKSKLVSIVYSVDGTPYQKHLPMQLDRVTAGETIVAYYDKDNPAYITPAEKYNYSGIIFPALWGFLSVYTAVSDDRKAKRRRVRVSMRYT
jgi:hypothetical protein